MNPQYRHIEFSEPFPDTETEVRDPQPEAPVHEEPAAGAPPPKPGFRVRELIDGTILVRENMIRQLPFLIFLTFLGIVYIGNRFHAEYMVRANNALKTEVGDLRAEQITTTSELMNISRPSEVAALVRSRNLGLKESLEPPKKLKR